jgi:hypothetical protein
MQRMFQLLFPLFMFTTCKVNVSDSEAVAYNYLRLFDKKQHVIFEGRHKLWKRGDVYIQEIYTVKTETNSSTGTKVSYVPEFCKLVDLKSKTYFDFYTFSDTSKCFKKGILPDSLFKDGALSFHSDKKNEIEGVPEILSDTTINNRSFHRTKFFTKGYDSLKSYSIGFYPAEMPYSILSLEKSFSKSKNWYLQKILDYATAIAAPYAEMEVDIIAHELTPAERKIFDAWERYAKAHPVSSKSL